MKLSYRVLESDSQPTLLLDFFLSGKAEKQGLRLPTAISVEVVRSRAISRRLFWLMCIVIFCGSNLDFSPPVPPMRYSPRFRSKATLVNFRTVVCFHRQLGSGTWLDVGRMYSGKFF